MKLTIKKILLLLTFSFVIHSCTKEISGEDIIETIDTGTGEILSDENQILGFLFRSSDNTVLSRDWIGEITDENKTISFILPFKTETSSLIPEVIISDKATIIPDPSIVSNFENPVQYTVTSESGKSQTYTVTIGFLKPTNREVLIELYKANPNNTTGWDISSMNLSDYEGVKVDENGKVIELYLHDNNISSIPKEIQYLESLKILSFFGLDGLTELPMEISKLDSLEDLNIMSLPIRKLPEDIWNIQSLLNVQIIDCPIEQISKNIANAKSLLSLYFSRTKIREIPNEIEGLSSLEILSMANSENLEFIPDGLTKLLELEELYLPVNKIITLPNNIGNLTKLKIAAFNNNQLENLPKSIGKLENLRDLFLGNNNFNSLPIEMGNLVDLMFLSISKNEMLLEIPKEICALEETGTRIIKDEGVVCASK